jgi:hypothetical protein
MNTAVIQKEGYVFFTFCKNNNGWIAGIAKERGGVR